MTDKHTPGPWFATTSNTGHHIAELADGRIGAFCGVVGAEDDDESKANARLIAAAPELLEALQGFMRKGMDGQEEYEAAVKALNKALGGFGL